MLDFLTSFHYMYDGNVTAEQQTAFQTPANPPHAATTTGVSVMSVKQCILASSIALALAGPCSSALAHGALPAQDNQPQRPTVQASNVAQKGAAASPTPKGASTAKPVTLQSVVVVGIRGSQLRAIGLKRLAPDIQDSITAQNIGELPDTTISDSLSRITGVQINRSAGEGSTISVLGLPEVSTLINGEAFISADNIDSIQPNYEAIPAQLFDRVDVLKSPTADILTSGISGTIDLRTRRPWDLKNGLTTAFTAQGTEGSETHKAKPTGNFLVSYNHHGEWGALFSASYSDTYHLNDTNGLSLFGGRIQGENSTAANQPGVGYLSGWAGRPIPAQVVSLPDGGVDVNGDGKSNGAFYIPESFTAFDGSIQRKRAGYHASIQGDIGNGFTVTADGFLTQQTEYSLIDGAQTAPIAWMAATALPIEAQATNVVLHNPTNSSGQQGDWNQTFFTTQEYKEYAGDLMSYTSGARTHSISRNFNVELDYDDGGPFTADVRWVNASAGQQMRTGYTQFSRSRGFQWPNTLNPGVSLPPGEFVYPANDGGNRPFNPNGLAGYSYPFTIDMSGGQPSWSLPASLSNALTDPEQAVLKGMAFQNNYNAGTDMNVFRIDGSYAFSPSFTVKAGLRNSIRSANTFTFNLTPPVYAGNGASDPSGCYTLYLTADVVMDGGGVPGACTAGNAVGFFRAGSLTGNPASKLPVAISSNYELVDDPGKVHGLSMYVLNPDALKNPVAYENALYPGAVMNPLPGSTWDVLLHERTGYAEALFRGTVAGLPFSGNIGLRAVKTGLDVDQHLVGAAQPYGLAQLDGGEIRTERSYIDWLPALNFAVDLSPKWILRLAASKNMMPLTLDEWGGGLTLGYSFQVLPNGKSVFAVEDGSSAGNPELKPWRSTNYGASLEFYPNNDSLVSVALFDIRVASFIAMGGVQNCDEPDQDGVVRDRCIVITEPVQGEGQTLKGVELDYRQAFTWAPGFLSNTGAEVNFTYSPSTTGEDDLAGNSIPFPGNSKESGNLILWYQANKWQVRAALNYRSKEAIEQNYDAISGLELYQKATTFLDASVSYRVTRHLQLFLQGSNLTGEKLVQYLVWPDQVNSNNYFESEYMAGIRGNF